MFRSPNVIEAYVKQLQEQLDEAAGNGCAEEAALCVESTGDMMGLCEQAGTAGPGATHFCLFCEATLTKVGGTLEPGWPQLPWVPSDWRRAGRGVRGGRRHHPYLRVDPRGAAARPPLRSLAGMHAHSTAYKAAVAKARRGESAQVNDSIKFTNCEDPPVFSGDMSPLSLWGAMTLHIDLGVGKELHDKLQARLEEFDREVANYGGAREHELSEQIRAKEAEVNTEEERAKLAEANIAEHEAFITVLKKQEDTAKAAGTLTSEQARAMRTEILDRNVAIKRAKVEQTAAVRALKILKPELKTLSDQRARGQGPFTKDLMERMADAGVERQKYHSQAFVGSDISDLFCDDRTIAGFTDLLCARSVLCSDGHYHSVGSDTEAAQWFGLFSDFAACRHLYARVAPLCSHEMLRFERVVEDFQCSYACVIGKKPTPKLHLLGYHLLDIMRLKGSTGQLTESMVESAHATINRMQSKLKGVGGRGKLLDVTVKRVAEASACEDLGAAEHAQKAKARSKKNSRVRYR